MEHNYYIEIVDEKNQEYVLIDSHSEGAIEASPHMSKEDCERYLRRIKNHFIGFVYKYIKKINDYKLVNKIEGTATEIEKIFKEKYSKSCYQCVIEN